MTAIVPELKPSAARAASNGAPAESEPRLGVVGVARDAGDVAGDDQPAPARELGWPSCEWRLCTTASTWSNPS